MIIHIILKSDTSSESQTTIIRYSRMTNVNERRLAKYGILSGDVPDDTDLDGLAVSFSEHISGIEKDETRRIMSS
jgi:hypothetical protein